MRASSDFAGREGPVEVYGRLSKARPWQPKSGSRAAHLKVISNLADQCFIKPPVDNDTLAAAYTFFGQFVTHDVTFDTRLDPRSARHPRRNLRTPALDLDSVYGRGPVEQPYLYELADHERFCVPRNELGERDLPRNDDDSVVHPSAGGLFSRRRSALISDPRNDENVLIAQLHLAFLSFHNARLEEIDKDDPDRFAEARRQTTWHYQWVLAHDFLPRLCGPDVIDKLYGRRSMVLESLPSPSPLLPYEFTLAAFRFGHSMVGETYHLNDELQKALSRPFRMFADTKADFRSRDRDAADTLEGERALPKAWTVQWDRFLELASGETQWSGKIDLALASSLQRLPLRGVSEPERSLPFRTLLHGYEQNLPSGQSLARELGVKIPPALAKASDPLWIYVLREAAIARGGLRLGPLGSTLVGEVLIGILRHDENSFVNRDPDWIPTLEARSGSQTSFDLADFLMHADVPVTAVEWRRRASP